MIGSSCSASLQRGAGAVRKSGRHGDEQYHDYCWKDTHVFAGYCDNIQVASPSHLSIQSSREEGSFPDSPTATPEREHWSCTTSKFFAFRCGEAWERGYYMHWLLKCDLYLFRGIWKYVSFMKTVKIKIGSPIMCVSCNSNWNCIMCSIY